MSNSKMADPNGIGTGRPPSPEMRKLDKLRRIAVAEPIRHRERGGKSVSLTEFKDPESGQTRWAVETIESYGLTREIRDSGDETTAGLWADAEITRLGLN
ncbi:hypothetical protein [Streptomyces sp. SID14515]|uniref:hypothetical protein n=1 Tax=Streptomyces sp. SID14515 TaxID=2706074 RepID=UPI0013CD8D42|nr:hypothetical protein [Streptomyces sp. SID14515]NEB42553.1 hypothetical protein [Streptomyces sp. SID14515]